MGPIEGLKLALAKEVEAAQLYLKMSKDYPVAEDVFLFLMGEEEKHMQVIEKKISALSK